MEYTKLNVRDTGATAEQIRAHLGRMQDSLQIATEERTQAKRDEMYALELVLQADRMQSDRESRLVEDIPSDIAREDVLRERAAELYSSSSQHNEKANAHEQGGNSEAREAKLIADQGQALPATIATRDAGKRSKRERRPGAGQNTEHAISR